MKHAGIIVAIIPFPLCFCPAAAVADVVADAPCGASELTALALVSFASLDGFLRNE